MSTLKPEEIGKLVVEFFDENRFHSAPGKYQLFAAALEAELRKRWFAEPKATLVACENMRGKEWFDIKVRDRSMPNGTLLYTAPHEQEPK